MTADCVKCSDPVPKCPACPTGYVCMVTTQNCFKCASLVCVDKYTGLGAAFPGPELDSSYSDEYEYEDYEDDYDMDAQRYDDLQIGPGEFAVDTKHMKSRNAAIGGVIGGVFGAFLLGAVIYWFFVWRLPGRARKKIPKPRSEPRKPPNTQVVAPKRPANTVDGTKATRVNLGIQASQLFSKVSGLFSFSRDRPETIDIIDTEPPSHMNKLHDTVYGRKSDLPPFSTRDHRTNMTPLTSPLDSPSMQSRSDKYIPGSITGDREYKQYMNPQKNAENKNTSMFHEDGLSSAKTSPAYPPSTSASTVFARPLHSEGGQGALPPVPMHVETSSMAPSISKTKKIIDMIRHRTSVLLPGRLGSSDGEFRAMKYSENTAEAIPRYPPNIPSLRLSKVSVESGSSESGPYMTKSAVTKYPPKLPSIKVPNSTISIDNMLKVARRISSENPYSGDIPIGYEQGSRGGGSEPGSGPGHGPGTGGYGDEGFAALDDDRNREEREGHYRAQKDGYENRRLEGSSLNSREGSWKRRSVAESDMVETPGRRRSSAYETQETQGTQGAQISHGNYGNVYGDFNPYSGGAIVKDTLIEQGSTNTISSPPLSPSPPPIPPTNPARETDFRRRRSSTHSEYDRGAWGHSMYPHRQGYPEPIEEEEEEHGINQGQEHAGETDTRNMHFAHLAAPSSPLHYDEDSPIAYSSKHYTWLMNYVEDEETQDMGYLPIKPLRLSQPDIEQQLDYGRDMSFDASQSELPHEDQ